MANPFYNPSGNPQTGSEGLSALIRGEFVAIGAAFDLMPRITTTGLFDTVFNQQGSYTFTLPNAPGTLAMTADVATETTRAEAAETVLTAAVSSEAASRATADGVNATAIGTETTRATAAEALLAPKASPGLTGTPTAPTAAPGTNTTQLGTTAFATAAVLVETGRATTAEGTNATAIATETTRATAAELVALGGIGRNRLHNGGFGINQRAQVSGAALTVGVYGHDRWKAGAGGCTYTFTQTQPATVITITAGTLQQVVEALTVEGGSYTLSWVGTATARINSGSYLASPITVTGLSSNTAITVEFNTGTVDRAQLEPGTAATVFARRSYRFELAECQRFYRQGQGALLTGYGVSGTTVGYIAPIPVSMRAAPSPNITSTTGSSNIGTITVSTGIDYIYYSTTLVATGQFVMNATVINLAADL